MNRLYPENKLRMISHFVKTDGKFLHGYYLYDSLKTFVTNKMVGNQKIVIKKISASATSFNCHILFITDEEGSNLKKIVDNT